MAGPSPAPSLAERVRAVEARARELAKSGDFEASHLAAEVVRLTERIAEAAEQHDSTLLLEAARKVAASEAEGGIVRLSALVSKASAGLIDLLKKAPNEAERERLRRLTNAYVQLDEMCREVAGAVITLNMAKRRASAKKVAAAAAEAKQGIAAAKAGAPAAAPAKPPAS